MPSAVSAFRQLRQKITRRDQVATTADSPFDERSGIAMHLRLAHAITVRAERANRRALVMFSEISSWFRQTAAW